MQMPRVRLRVRWLVASVGIAGMLAVLVTIERRERLRCDIALSRAETPYRSAKLARERAEAAVYEYAEGTFRRELAAVEVEVKQAEGQLRVATNAPPDWAERIRAKGYLLFVTSYAPSRKLNIKKAVFAAEQARSKRQVLEKYTKVKTLKELNDRVAKSRADETVMKAAYERAKTAGVGIIGKVLGRR
jgi:HlyD family secretion protein